MPTVSTFWSQDVCLLAVCIADQSDVSCSVRIVLNTNSTFAGTSSFASLEVDDSVFSSASASVVSDSDLTLVVASSVFFKDTTRDFSGVSS